MNPLSTGSEMKPARKPSRHRPATSAAIPVTIARAAVRVTNAGWPCVAKSATAAADSAAVADIGPTIRWRELPKIAYRTSAGGAA